MGRRKPQGDVGTVMCTSTHVVTLDDGRTVAPGATAEDVDINHAHNKALIDEEQLFLQDAKAAPNEGEQNNEGDNS